MKYNSDNENSLNETKNELATEIVKVSPKTTSNVALNFIERAHCITSNTRREGPPHLLTKIKSWNT